MTVTFTASDGTGSGVSATSYSIDGGSLQPGNSAIVAAPGDHSNDGSHVVQYFSTDDVGNVETPKTVTVVIDTTAPSGAAGDPGTYLRGIANLTYSTAATDVSSVQFQFSPAGAGALVEHRRRRHLAAVRGGLEHRSSSRTGPMTCARSSPTRRGNVANELLPGLPKTVDNAAPSGQRHLAGRRGVRLRHGQRHRDRDRRRRPARLRRLGRPLRDQALRRRRVQRLRHAERRPSSARPTSSRSPLRPPGRAGRAPRRRHRRRRQRDDLRRPARSRSTTTRR